MTNTDRPSADRMDQAVEAFLRFVALVVARLQEAGDTSVFSPRPNRRPLSASEMHQRFTAFFAPTYTVLDGLANSDEAKQAVATTHAIGGFHAAKIEYGFPAEAPQWPESDQFLREYLGRVVVCAFAAASIWPPPRDVIIEQFRRCCAAWASDHIDFLAVAPVYGLRASSFDPIQVSERLHLAWLEHDHEHVLSAGRTSADLSSDISAMSVLVASVSCPKVSDARPLVEALEEEIAVCIAALRLSLGGHFGCPKLVLAPTPAFFQVPGMMNLVWYVGNARPREFTLGAESVVDEGAARYCRDVVAAARTGKLRALSVALDRFNSASVRWHREDQLIDLVIALESVLLPEKQADIGYRFALRGAALLGTRDEAAVARKYLRAMYDARSKIVHGSKKIADLDAKSRAGLTPGRFFDEAWKISRSILRLVLGRAMQGGSLDRLKADLEDRITQAIARLDNAD